MKLAAFATIVASFLIVTSPAVAQDTSDSDGVHAAVLDYLEGLYQAQPERIEQSVSPTLVKFGWYQGNPDADFQGFPMTFDQLKDLAAGWNEGNRQNITADSPREIVVLDVLSKTAVAKLTAVWGIDYFQLEKVEGRWMIRHVLWQSHPDA
jgi:Putative lumazine-binding